MDASRNHIDATAGFGVIKNSNSLSSNVPSSIPPIPVYAFSMTVSIAFRNAADRPVGRILKAKENVFKRAKS